MALELFTIILLALLPTLTNTAESITRVQIEDTPAYSAILFSSLCTGGCCRECATAAIDSFRTAHSCDSIDPFTCLCMDKTRSAGLRSAISNKCFNKCRAPVVPYSTNVLDVYCTMNETPAVQAGGPASNSASQTNGDSSLTNVASTTLSGSGPGITGFGPTPTPNLIHNPAKGNRLTLGDKVGIIIGTVGGFATVVGAVITFFAWWRPRHVGGNNNGVPAAVGNRAH